MMKKPIKILFPIASFYPAQNGGPDNTVYWITKALTRRGHEPIIAADDLGLPEGMPRNQWLDKEWGQIKYSHDLHPFFPVNIIRHAYGRLKEADVIHMNMITSPSGAVIAILNSWFHGKPMVWSSRGDLDPPMLLRSPRKKALMLWLINNVVNKDLLWFHSTCDAESDYVRNNFGQDSKIIQIPNYMELPELIEVPNEPYLLYLGRIDKKKGLENLIDGVASSDLFRSSRFTLKIAGDHNTPYGQGLVKQVADAGLKDKVEFTGHVAGGDKEMLLAKAYFSLMPSHTENFGVVVLEAMAQGTPAVASHGTPWKILQDHDAGFWVDNSPATLKKTVEEIITLTPQRMQELEKNALALAETNFDMHKNIDEWINAYQMVIDQTAKN